MADVIIVSFLIDFPRSLLKALFKDFMMLEIDMVMQWREANVNNGTKSKSKKNKPKKNDTQTMITL